MRKLESKFNKMTQGPVGRTLFSFAIPLLGCSLVQQLYNTADFIFVSRYVGKTSAAAVAASSILFTCLICLFTGLSVGISIVIAQACGRGDTKKHDAIIQNALLIGIFGSVAVMAIGIWKAYDVLRLLQTPEDIMQQAVLYIRIYFLSMPAMVLYNFGVGIDRAEGDAKTPLRIMCIGGMTNVIVDYLFIGCLQRGVVGAAAATNISQLLTAALAWMGIYRHHKAAFGINGIRIQKSICLEILKIGLPAAVQSTVLTLSNMIVQYYINGYGTDSVAAFATYFKMENFIYYPIISMGQAITTFVGQNIGAKNYERLSVGIKWCLIISVSVTVCISGIVLLLQDSVIRLFIRDTGVVDIVKQIIMVTLPFYWFYAVMETFGGTIRGMGHTFALMLIVMGCLCGCRILLLNFWSNHNGTIRSVASVYPMTWFMTMLLFIMAYFIQRKRIAKEEF